MPKNKKIILGLLACSIVVGTTLPGQAQEENAIQTEIQKQVRGEDQEEVQPEVLAETQPVSKPENKTTDKTAAKQANTPQAPIVIEADNLSFSDETGDIVANGKVVITSQQRQLQAEHIDGNTKLSEVWINENAVFSDKLSASILNGNHTIYNYKLKTGSMEQAKGKITHKYVSGESISMFPDKYLITQGTTTNCPAKIPDYHISADRIEIWPNDQMIAYNAKFWIGNTVIFSMPKYRQGIGKNAKESSFPSIGYNTDQGFYIRQHLEYPLNNKLSAYTNLDYYSKEGFKPNYSLMQRESNYSFEAKYGHYLDDDDNWIKKEPEFEFKYYPHRLGRLPVSYTISGIYGKWTDDYKTSWHQEYEIYFTRDPIKLNSTMNLYLGTGFEHIRESYNDSKQNIFKYDVTISKKWSQRLSSWVGYHYTQNNVTLFEYDSDDASRKFQSGFVYRFDKMNSISISRNYNLDSKKVEDLDYTWYRNLHCWQGTLTYKAKEKKYKFDITTTRW